MKEFLRINWFKLLVSLVLLVIAGSIFYALVIGSSYRGEQSVIAPIQKVDNIKLPVQITSTSVQNNDLILLNYKVDTSDVSKAASDLLQTAYSSPRQFCPSVISERTTRGNLYYIVEDEILRLKRNYDQYKTSIKYIGNNLASFDQEMNIVRDQCEAIGYSI